METERHTLNKMLKFEKEQFNLRYEELSQLVEDNDEA